jgi:hypothetical protein
MPQSIVVIVLIRTLIKTKGVGQHTELTVYSTSDSLEQLEIAVYIVVQHNGVSAQRLEVLSPSYAVHMSYG